MSQIETEGRGILQLPVELLQNILTCLPDPRSLVRTIQASPTLLLSFKGNEQRIIAAVLTNCIGTGVLREVWLTRVCAPPVLSTKLVEQPIEVDEDEDMQVQLDTYITEFLHDRMGAGDVTLTSWNLSDALALGYFHTEVILPLKDRFIEAASDGASCSMAARVKNSLRGRPASRLEEERICRSLYRFELFRRLFGCFSWRSDVLVDFMTMFFSKFAPWEIAQLGCIHDFLGGQIVPGKPGLLTCVPQPPTYCFYTSPYLFLSLADYNALVFNEVARHDIVWGELNIMFDARVVDGTIQHLLTLGLETILDIGRLQKAIRRARKHSTLGIPCPLRTTISSTWR